MKLIGVSAIVLVALLISASLAYTLFWPSSSPSYVCTIPSVRAPAEAPSSFQDLMSILFKEPDLAKHITSYSSNVDYPMGSISVDNDAALAMTKCELLRL